MKWTNKSYDTVQQLIAAYRAGDRPRLLFGTHFVERMRGMRVSEDELFDTISNPDEVQYSRKYDACYLMHGRITVSIQLDLAGYPDAVTILWRHQEDWKDAARSGVMGGQGRAPRDDLSHLPSRTG